MRPSARNRTAAPRSNGFSSPPVPAGFEVEQPSQLELQVRETTATVRGVRVIESAWPGQPPRRYSPMGRTNYTHRGGGGGGGTGNLNNRGTGPGQGGSTPTQPHSSQRRGQTPAARTPVGVRGDDVVDNSQYRTVPLLKSLPTEAERIATQQARTQAEIERKREEKQRKRLAKNSHVASSAQTTNTPGPAEPAENRNMGRTSSNSPQAIFIGNNCRSWPEITIRVGPDLPMKYTTWDMYCLFSDYGEIESIELCENNSGTRTGIGKVKFSRIFELFWNQSFITYTWNNTNFKLKIEILPLPAHKFTIQSPIDKNREYPQKYTFTPKEMDFGFMIGLNSMVAMYTTNDTDEITFGVDLYRKCIDVIFNIYLSKEETSPDSKEKEEQFDSPESEPGKGARRETYRFRVPFAHLGKILEQSPVIPDGNRTILISLPSPPLFWRKLYKVANSHDHKAKYWSTWEMWFRQTSIAFDPLLRSTLPISLRQILPIIDTGRWTTYRFKFALGPQQNHLFEEMISALGDFNVDTETLDGLKVTNDQPEPIWDSIDLVKDLGPTTSFSGGLSEAVSPLLPYPLRYQLEVCISQNCLNEYNITVEFINRLMQLPFAQAVRLLECVAGSKNRIYNPMDIFNLRDLPRGTEAQLKKLPDCQLVRKASVTPSTVYYTTPTVEYTNRVMRHYSRYCDRFLRVQFVDEKSQGRINATDKKAMNEVFSRINTAMENGIQIGDRHFEFLAFGNSQIREHGAYFFASTDHISAADIRAWMGEFSDIRIVAKHAARLGQCFSTTRAIRGVQVDVRKIEDIKYEDNQYNFSDGVGKMSQFVARMIATELDVTLPKNQYQYPSCVQFRLGGCKGVLTVWPEVKGREVFIRPSQRKFDAEHNILEVIRISKFATAALNRQLIIVLSSLGTPDNVFILKLTLMLGRFQDAMDDSVAALSLLCRIIDANQFTLSLAAMVRDKFMDFKEPFIMSLMGLWRAWSIKYLKEKARIMIDEGAFVLGVVDETGILKGYDEDESDDEADRGKTRLPEIFLQITDPDDQNKLKVIEGLCIIARNPSLHPGDIRTVRAVNVPELRHLRDVVVFPNKGDRDLPSMLSGGDLDGDDYIVIWDTDLTRWVTNHKPMDYLALEPRTLTRNVTVSDITKFFVNYMKNDRLGSIANAHLAWADSHDDGVKSDECFRLAELHSDAVDYVKTGEPAEMPADLRPRKYPHFMEKEPEKTRRSHKILGRLYDEVEKVNFVPCYEFQFDDRILSAYTLSEDLLTAAREVKTEYDAALHRILAQHEIRTEFEVYSTFIMHHSTATKDYKFHEEIASIRDSLKGTFKKIVIEKAGHEDEVELGPFIAAMYTVTKLELDMALEAVEANKGKGKGHACPTERKNSKFSLYDVNEMPLISFPWLFPEILGRLANREYPFTNIGKAHDECLEQSKYDHVAIPDTKRGAIHKKGTNTTQYNRFEDEIYNFEGDNSTVLDPSKLEIEPAKYPGAYINFDYKKQMNQDPDRRMSKMGTKNHAYGNDSDNSAFNHKEGQDEFGAGKHQMDFNKKENHFPPSGSSHGSSNG